MIRLENIKIEEFRGIRELFVDFKGKNFAVCGPNGTGKSGIVDAVEFGLTGSVSRLSGSGTGVVSIKDHGPHVDSRNRPDRAKVTLRITIPASGKSATVVRCVANPKKPTVTPNDPEVLCALRHIELHPEFVLSRRELIRYVVATPGKRAEEVRALLRLDKVENIRTILQRIANACRKDSTSLESMKELAKNQLLSALGIAQLETQQFLAAVNAQREVLRLEPIGTLTQKTSVKDGLSSQGSKNMTARVPKEQAVVDLQNAVQQLGYLEGEEVLTLCSGVAEQIDRLAKDPIANTNVTRAEFLKSSLNLIENETCPVCGTQWKHGELERIIGEKLKHFDSVTQQRAVLERQLEPLTNVLIRLKNSLMLAARYAALLGIKPDDLNSFNLKLENSCSQLQKFLPLSATRGVLNETCVIPAAVRDLVQKIEGVVKAIPDSGREDAAREYLIVAQERLEHYRDASFRHKQTQDRSILTNKISETYAKASDEILEGVYKEVEKDFSELYRFINREDEGSFEAKLKPSMGKLGFDVDFYGRGFFPPGAYHSEGHQDSMGLCLYLALMKHMLGNEFTFAVLDDVLMSVDSGHRREFCALLKKRFSDTQFILTTHDPIWLRHMKTEGIIAHDGCLHIRDWDVDHGPTKYDNSSVWDAINQRIKENDMIGAASMLRNHLEYIALEMCHRVRAKVELRGDAQYQLGDLLPAATAQMTQLLARGIKAAQSWDKTDEANVIKEKETKLATLVKAANMDQWQVNPSIHYNEWANFASNDFYPVAESFCNLINAFVCGECGGTFYITPERGGCEFLRCDCARTSINLKKREQ